MAVTYPYASGLVAAGADRQHPPVAQPADGSPASAGATTDPGAGGAELVGPAVVPRWREGAASLVLGLTFLFPGSLLLASLDVPDPAVVAAVVTGLSLVGVSRKAE